MEMVRHPRFDSITDRIFGEMQSATRKAGRGEMISYRNVTKTIEMESPVADEFASSRRAIENAMTLNGRSF